MILKLIVFIDSFGEPFLYESEHVYECIVVGNIEAIEKTIKQNDNKFY
jgi:hypothetical protein